MILFHIFLHNYTSPFYTYLFTLIVARAGPGRSSNLAVLFAGYQSNITSPCNVIMNEITGKSFSLPNRSVVYLRELR